jgi:hypothetical protein
LNGTDRRIAVGLFLLAFGAYAFFAGGGGWNQNAQLALTRAIVEQQTFAIDSWRDTTGDVSEYGGHTYANKPPGLSLIAVPFYAAIYGLESLAGADVNAPLTAILNLWLVTLLTCGVCGAVIPALLYLHGREAIGVSRSEALSIALIFAFATYIFAYSTVLFAHVPSAMLILLAFMLRDRRPLLAGVAAGLAGLCFYVCIPAAVILVAFSRSRRAALQMIAGGLPSGVILGVYHLICFGSPFATSVESSTAFTEPGAALGVMVAPRMALLFALTLSAYRGLFYLSPVLLMALAGAVAMWRSGRMRREFWIIASLITIFLAFNISFNGWHGGSAIGPRYLLTIVPFLAIPMCFAVRAFKPLWIALTALSFVFNLLATAVNPLPSKLIDRPLDQYVIPLYVTGHLPASIPREPLWSWKVMLGHVSVNRHTPDESYPYTKHAPNSAPSDWASFNLGEIFMPGSPLSIVPVVLWIAIGSATLFRVARRGANDAAKG